MSEEIKRIVRQRCGFGCVVCGLGYYDYHHVTPYSKVKEHNPYDIVLLCAHHHTEFERGRLSGRKLLNAAKAPMAIQLGYAHGVFESSDKPLRVNIGGNAMINTPTIIAVGSVPIIGFTRPENIGEPWQMTAFMTDTNGTPLLSIKENIWNIHPTKWDVQAEGQILTIRNGSRDIGVRLRHEPGESLTIERLKMRFAGYYIDGTEHRLMINTNTISGSMISNGSVGISLGVDDAMESIIAKWSRAVGNRFALGVQK